MYDRDDAHYDTISAFIKSMRGSDADAAVYYLASMIAGGEDPKFIARRMIVFASEDVGNADPQALQVAVAAARAVEFVGLPECRINLSQAAIYLALAPKSNAAYKAVDAALDDVRREGNQPPPPHLRDANYRGAKELGHGAGYKYPHASGGWVEQQYLPDKLSGRRYYVPIRGVESELAARLEETRRRAASRRRRSRRTSGHERRVRVGPCVPRRRAGRARRRLVLRAPGQERPRHLADGGRRRHGPRWSCSPATPPACYELSSEPILLKQSEEGVRVQIEHRPMLPLMAFVGKDVSAALTEAAGRVSEQWGPKWVVLLTAREDGDVSVQRLA